MIKWVFYPKSKKAPPLALQVVEAFQIVEQDIASESHDFDSNQALKIVAGRLAAIGFQVETGKKASEKICVPVLFGVNGKPEKSFDADAYHEPVGFVIEVEAGRAIVNN